MPSVQARSNVSIRLAKRDEGLELYRLYLASGKSPLPDVDWSRDPTPYWLIAEADGERVGCINVCPSKPIARIDLLCIIPWTSHRIKAIATRDLMLTALATCREMGAQAVAGTIDMNQPGYEMMMSHRGGVKWFDGRVFIKRVK